MREPPFVISLTIFLIQCNVETISLKNAQLRGDFTENYVYGTPVCSCCISGVLGRTQCSGGGAYFVLYPRYFFLKSF
ncbi:hypothetical protein PsAD26_02676 [Pseudovibrio sp. Ad26]|nr:hypothetical protein PsAD26_02676 [Pseudovibrio sp. Ad26]